MGKEGTPAQTQQQNAGEVFGEGGPRAKDAEIVLTNKTVLSSDVIKQLPKLKYIGVLATGYNIVDIEAARDLCIPVTNVPAYSTQSME